MDKKRRERMEKHILNFVGNYKQYSCREIDVRELSDDSILMLEDVYYITALSSKNDKILFRTMLDGLTIRQLIRKQEAKRKRNVNILL